jgi:hypothetical protein
MQSSSDAAEQVMRLSLQGTEVALRLTGNITKHTVAMIAALANENHKSAGKTRLTKMLKSGEELKVFSVPAEALKDFQAESKRYGVLYCAVKDKDAAEKSAVDIMVYAKDASKINRVVERLGIATVGTVQQEENPTKAGRQEEKSQPANSSKNAERSSPSSKPKQEPEAKSEPERKSVRKTMAEIKADMERKEKMAPPLNAREVMEAGKFMRKIMKDEADRDGR